MFQSLYIHVPFCAAKCAYCAFYSEPGAGAELRQAYTRHLCEELRRNASHCSELSSIFVGGGTPSLLTPQEWKPILDCIHGNFSLADGYEWTMEANPESLSEELISLWAASGVNRISMGIQAFQPELRRRIGRNGSLKRLPEIVRALGRNHILRYNFDLIFNIPGQTTAQWQESLEKALAFHPTHLSCYALTIEEGTRLAAQHISPDDESFLDFWNLTDSILATHGIRRYEISNFAVPGQECRHNLEIWKGATYLGCGPAATSFDGKDRWSQPASITKWLNNTPPEVDSLMPDERAAEILAFGMRVVKGWDWKDYTRRTGFNPLTLRGNQLQKLASNGLISLTPDGAAPTQQGLLFNDDVAMELL